MFLILLTKYRIECRKEHAVRHIAVEDRVQRGVARENEERQRGGEVSHLQRKPGRKIGWPVAIDAVDGARECVCVAGCDAPMSAGRSRTYSSNSRAPMRCESSVGLSRTQNSFSIRKFATRRVIPANRPIERPLNGKNIDWKRGDHL